MYKAVFIDLDGTLLNNDHRISEETERAIRRLLLMGIHIVPVSARPLHAILPITQPLIDDSMPVISLNGSYIYHGGKVLHEVFIQSNDMKELDQFLQELKSSVMYYHGMEWFAKKETALIIKEQQITEVPIRFFPPLKPDTESGIHRQEYNKLLLAGEPEEIEKTGEKLRLLFQGRLNVYQSQAGYLEIMDRRASKTNGIKFLLPRLGLGNQEIIAIGDNFNDQEMIEFAGLGIAMGNAPDEIKKSADYITDTNERDGVARALNHFFNLS